MELLKTDYRPANVEFEVANNSILPENLGTFKTADEANKALKDYFTVSSNATVFRFMDNFEKNEIRKEYAELLEVRIPLLERDLDKATSEFQRAKKNLAEATEAVNARLNETKALAMEVKRGVKEISLDEMFTHRIPFEGKYYFYTFIDNQLKLCKVSDIPSDEKADLFNAMNNNDSVITERFTCKGE